MWVRGLKPSFNQLGSRFIVVAPHVGAWIETHIFGDKSEDLNVAPHVGAWIETRQNGQELDWQNQSHPMWVRGLKHGGFVRWNLDKPVAPHVGAWIETKWVHPSNFDFACRTPCGCVD